MLRYALSMVLAGVFGGCGDNKAARNDAGLDASDAGQDLAHCLDRPADIVRVPNGQLPCDLLPPGFGQ